MKILNEEHFENVKRYAESIGDTSLRKCLERLKSWEENPDCPSEISLYYDHAPYSFGFTQHYPDGRTGIVGGPRYNTVVLHFYLKQQIFPLFFLYRLNIPVQHRLRQYKASLVPSPDNLPYSDPEYNTSGLQVVFHTEYSSNLPAQPLESRND